MVKRARAEAVERRKRKKSYSATALPWTSASNETGRTLQSKMGRHAPWTKLGLGRRGPGTKNGVKGKQKALILAGEKESQTPSVIRPGKEAAAS